jgi:peptidoglycan/LPS O-acetylase OafA/YrhL
MRRAQVLRFSPITAREVSTDFWASLSAARFFLATWVLFAHTYNFGPAARAMPVPSSNALLAVYCFLAISGFSIHHSILVKPLNYASRRVARIMPSHLASVVLALFAYALGGGTLFDGHGNPWPHPSFNEWLGCFLLLQALLPVAAAVLFPSWSLSIEVIYYAIAPLLQRTALVVPVGLVVVSCAFCFLRPYISELYIGSDTYGFSVGAMLWAWLAGWLAYGGREKIWAYTLCMGAGTLVIWIDPLLSGFFNYACWSIVITLLWFGDAVCISTSTRSLAQYLGELSYPLYITHYPLLFLLYNFALKSNPNWNWGVIQVFVVGSSTMIIYHFIDRPCRGWAAARLKSTVPVGYCVDRSKRNLI